MFYVLSQNKFLFAFSGIAVGSQWKKWEQKFDNKHWHIGNLVQGCAPRRFLSTGKAHRPSKLFLQDPMSKRFLQDPIKGEQGKDTSRAIIASSDNYLYFLVVAWNFGYLMSFISAIVHAHIVEQKECDCISTDH